MSEPRSLRWPDLDDEVSARIRRHDWSSTALGPVATWPSYLKTAVDLALRWPAPALVLWGAEGLMLFNDRYARLSEALPRLGRPVREGEHAVASLGRELVASVVPGGSRVFRDRACVLVRKGVATSARLDIDVVPFVDDAARTAGVFAVVSGNVPGDRERAGFGRKTGDAEGPRDVADARVSSEGPRAPAETEHGRALTDDLLARVTHELRTPLAAARMWLHVLRGDDGSQRERALDAIEQSLAAQSSLINDLLDVARAASGKLSLDVAPVDVGDVVRSCVELLANDADTCGVTVAQTVDQGAWVRGDAARLRQVVTNLITNAIKFSPPGCLVAVHVTTGASDVEISVRDEGAGITAAYLPHVFTPFSQSGTMRAGQGLGLGLSIARELVELHAGNVVAESEGAGQGATFTVTLPRSFDAPAHRGRATSVYPPTNPLRGVRIAIVDDDDATREGLETVLAMYGADVIAAGSASEARAKLVGVPDVRAFVFDISMPGEDGYSLLQSIRSTPTDAVNRTPAVALTALAREEDRRRAFEAGFDAHVTKPVEANDLITILRRLVGRE